MALGGGRTALVGREDERRVLAALVAALPGGAGGTALLQGEGGIGKTRLLEEALDGAARLGVRVLRGQAHDLERTRPFGPLDPLFALLADEPGLAELRWSQQGPGAQYRIVEALVGLVERLSADAPLVVAIEDLHWADGSTLLTLHGLGTRLRHLPLLLLATLRPPAPGGELDRLVGALTAGGGRLLRLGALPAEDVARLSVAVTGAQPGPGLRAQLGRANGNPLFVTELLRSLADEGALAVGADLAEVAVPVLPPSLRLVLLHRLRALPAATLELLRVAAVLGPVFDAAALARVTGHPGVELIALLDEALRAGVLGDDGGRLAFRHDLLWEALYADLAPALRRGLHADIARALAGSGAPAQVVAEHFAAAAEPGDREAVQWLQAAARESLSRSPAAAADLLRRAAALTQGDPAGRDAVLTELVAALLWAGSSEEAATLARELLERGQDPATEANLRIWLVDALGQQDRYAEAAAVGLAGLRNPALPPVQRAQLASETAYEVLMTGDEAAAVALAESARDSGDDRAACIGLDVLGLVTLGRGDVRGAVALTSEAAERARRIRPAAVEDAQAVVVCHYLLATVLTCADDLIGARRAIAEGRRRSEEVGNTLYLPAYHWLLAQVLFRAGEWDDAIAEAHAGLTLAAGGKARRGIVGAHGVLALVALQRNDLGAADAALADGERERAAQPTQPWRHWLSWAAALTAEARDDRSAAIARLEATWERLPAAGLFTEYRLIAPDLVRLHLAGGGTARAAEVTAAVEAAARVTGVAAVEAAALHCRGLVAGDAGLLVEAAGRLREVPAPLDAARALEDAGLAEEAAAAYEALGAVRAVARVEADLRARGVRRGVRGRRPPRPAHGWDSLTRTERQVVDLVVEGLTNREVGARLYVSPRTVETHLAHVFAKLGLSSRAALRAAHRAASPAGPTAPAAGPASR